MAELGLAIRVLILLRRSLRRGVLRRLPLLLLLLCPICLTLLLLLSYAPKRTWQQNYMYPNYGLTAMNKQLVDPLVSSTSKDPVVAAAELEAVKFRKDPLFGIRKLVERRIRVTDQDIFQFRLEEEEGPNAARWERVGSSQVRFTGSSVNALAKALGRFFEVNFNCSLLTWTAIEDSRLPHARCAVVLPLSESLAVPTGSVKSRVSWRYYLNQVTYSYSMVWWDWPRWEKELDWMAIKGINIALAHVGQEVIWERVFRQFHPSFDRDSFFTGPAYLSWNRMGNLKRLGSPLNTDWMQAQLALNHRILARMNSLGISPVLPAFNGHVPDAFKHLIPRQDFTLSSLWSGFNSTFTGVVRLEPHSPLFVEVGRAIIREQLKEYKLYLSDLSEHFYSTDTFNEMDPEAHTDLAQIGANLFLSIIREDAKGVVVMQMWCFAHAPRLWTAANVLQLFSKIPAQNLLLLDLHGEKRAQWRRLKAYLDSRPAIRVIWTLLHNFGGGHGMAGEMEDTKNALLLAIEEGGVDGVGLAMEGTQQNAVLYDLVLDLAWLPSSSQTFAVGSWLESWVASRYSHKNSDLFNAWRCMVNTAYSRPSNLAGWGNTKSIFELHPQLRMFQGGFQPTAIGYSPGEFFRCVTAFLEGMDAVAEAKTVNLDDLLYDLIDVIRQASSDLALQSLEVIRQAFLEGNSKVFAHISAKLLAILKALGDLMRHHPFWTVEEIALPKWTQRTSAFHEHHLRQAKTLITQWSPHTQALHSYSSRQLSGLMELYLERWKAFIALLSKLLQLGDSFSFDEREALLVKYTALENAWIRNSTVSLDQYQYQPRLIRIKARRLYSRLQNLLRSLKV